MREKGKARARNKLQLCSVLLPESFGDAAFGHPPCPFGTRRSGFSRGPSSSSLVRSRTYQRGDAMKLCRHIVAGNVCAGNGPFSDRQHAENCVGPYT